MGETIILEYITEQEIILQSTLTNYRKKRHSAIEKTRSIVFLDDLNFTIIFLRVIR